jgi:hypothetical protein
MGEPRDISLASAAIRDAVIDLLADGRCAGGDPAPAAAAFEAHRSPGWAGADARQGRLPSAQP